MKQTVIRDDGHQAVIKCKSCGALTDLIYSAPDGLHKAVQQPCKRCKAQLLQDFINGAYSSF